MIKKLFFLVKVIFKSIHYLIVFTSTLLSASFLTGLCAFQLVPKTLIEFIIVFGLFFIFIVGGKQVTIKLNDLIKKGWI